MRCIVPLLLALLGLIVLSAELLVAALFFIPTKSLALLSLPGGAAAWGVTGHYVVADVAWGLMDTSIREVRRLRVLDFFLR